MTPTVQATPAFRRNMLWLALALAGLEAALFGAVWRLGLLIDPGADRRAAVAFVLLGSALTLQAMIVVGLAWTLVALSRTTLVLDEDHLVLEHPWRRWVGRYPQVRHAWRRGDWLTFEVTGSLRRWYVRVPPDSDADVNRLRAALEPGSWLDGADLARHLLSRVLPVFLGMVGLGGLLLLALLRYMQQASPSVR